MDKEEIKVDNLVKVTGTITESFRKLKFVTIAAFVCVFATAFGCVVYSMYSVSKTQGKVYVVDRGQAFSATMQDQGANRSAEVEHMSKYFHGLFFNVSPNMDVVDANIETAFRYCADNSVAKYYGDLREQGFYRNVQSAQAVQEVVVDSVKVNMRVYPYEVFTYSSLYITRPSLMVKSMLVTQMSMIDVTRDSFNPNGLKIESFSVPVNKEIERRKRN